MDVGVTCAHQFERVKTRETQIEAFGHRQRCKECLYEEIWTIKTKPGPDTSPALGEWEPSPVWLPDYLKHWGTE